MKFLILIPILLLTSCGRTMNIASKKIIQISKEGYKITEWDSLISAETFTGISRKGISACCCGNIKSSGGFIWKFL